MNNRFVLVLAGLVILFGGIFFFSKKDADAPTNGGQQSAQVSNHTFGEGKKGVTLVEYGDFECPACTAYHPLVKQVVEKYKSDITFQFVNFPLIQLHQNAMAAHRAAEAAGKQNKYWEMHDMLYQRASEWNGSNNASSIFQGYATQLGLDVEKFKQDAASSEVNGTINADRAKGQKLGVNSTPTFFLDGKKIDQAPQDVEGFSKLIDNAIANKQQQQ